MELKGLWTIIADDKFIKLIDSTSELCPTAREMLDMVGNNALRLDCDNDGVKLVLNSNSTISQLDVGSPNRSSEED